MGKKNIDATKLRGLFLLTGLVLILISTGGFFILNKKAVQERIVVLGEDGYAPQVLEISKNECVNFVTSTDKKFWPASDPHPVHNVYAKFDPLEPIEPNESWSFCFEAVGEWKFHDHLAPYFTGKIVVGEQNSEGKSFKCNELLKKEPTTFDKNLRATCWTELLATSLKKKGTKNAYTVFKRFYEKDPFFVETGCHQHAHEIGDFAYEEYLKHKDIKKLDLTIETTYCGYGFYHGLLEHLLRDEMDVEFSKGICSYLDEKFSESMPNIRTTCYHGIGHGFVASPQPNTDYWGNSARIMEKPLSVCDTISENNVERQECMQGAFNVLSEWVWNREFGLSPESDDPLRFCRDQSTRDFQLACHYEFSMHLAQELGKRDVEAIAAKYIDPIEDDVFANTAVTVVIAGIMQHALVEDDKENYIDSCKHLDSRLTKSCLGGVVGGLIAHGKPNQEYVEAVKICESSRLTEGERGDCYGRLFQAISRIYSKDKMADVCQELKEEFREICLSGNYKES